MKNYLITFLFLIILVMFSVYMYDVERNKYLEDKLAKTCNFYTQFSGLILEDCEL